MGRLWRIAVVAILLVGSTSAFSPSSGAAGGTAGTVSSYPTGFKGAISISCPTTTDCWVAGRYPTPGGSSGQTSAAVLHLTNGTPDTPQVIPGTPYFVPYEIDCWSAVDCTVASQDAGDNNFDNKVFTLHAGVASAPVSLNSGLSRGFPIRATAWGATASSS